jgi:hypothetical protein
MLCRSPVRLYPETLPGLAGSLVLEFSANLPMTKFKTLAWIANGGDTKLVLAVNRGTLQYSCRPKPNPGSGALANFGNPVQFP